MTAPASTGDAATGDAATITPAAVVGDESALGDAGKAALAAERKAKKAAESALAAMQAKLTALEDAGKSEAEKVLARAEKAEQGLAALTLAQLKRDVADEVKLPANLAARLVGSTRDELVADAKELAKQLQPATAGPAPADGKPTVRLAPTNVQTDAQALNGDPIIDALKAKLGIR